MYVIEHTSRWRAVQIYYYLFMRLMNASALLSLITSSILNHIELVLDIIIFPLYI